MVPEWWGWGQGRWGGRVTVSHLCSRGTQGSSPKALLTFRWVLFVTRLGCLSWWEGLWPDPLPQRSIREISPSPPRRKAEMGSGHSLPNPTHLTPSQSSPAGATHSSENPNWAKPSCTVQPLSPAALQGSSRLAAAARPADRTCRSHKVPDWSLLSWP